MGENSTLAKVNKLAALGAAAAAVTGIAGTEKAEASIIYSGVVNINIPSTTAGVYLNVVTGVSNTNPGLVPGWDVNPWSNVGLGFFNPTAPAGGVYVVTAPNFVANLAPSAAIGAANNYGSGTSTNTAQWVLNSQDNLVGFRFQNEANANATHYGWMRIGLSSSITAQPRSIIEYAYSDVAGEGVQAGVTDGQVPVPEPASLGLLALGVSGLVARRLRRSQAN